MIYYLNSKYFHELEQRSRSYRFSNDDGYARLVKVRRDKVHHFLALGGHGHAGHRDIDLPVHQVAYHSTPPSSLLITETEINAEVLLLTKCTVTFVYWE